MERATEVIFCILLRANPVYRTGKINKLNSQDGAFHSMLITQLSLIYFQLYASKSNHTPKTEKKAVLPKIKPMASALLMKIACASLVPIIITIHIPIGILFLPVGQDTVCINQNRRQTELLREFTVRNSNILWQDLMKTQNLVLTFEVSYIFFCFLLPFQLLYECQNMSCSSQHSETKQS